MPRLRPAYCCMPPRARFPVEEPGGGVMSTSYNPPLPRANWPADATTRFCRSAQRSV